MQSDLPVSLMFDGRMWIMGGRKLPGTSAATRRGHRPMASMDAGGRGRLVPARGRGVVVFKDRMWVMSGTESFMTTATGW